MRFKLQKSLFKKPQSKRDSLIESVETYYNRLSQRYDDPVKAVGWISSETQHMRYEQLSLIGNVNQCHVLDVGCGVGDLYPYLVKEFDGGLTYHGIDVSQEMVKRARGRHPGVKFDCRDLFQWTPKQPYDYVFASGAFSYWTKDPLEQVKKGLDLLYSWCVQGVAINFLSSYAPRSFQDMKYFVTYKPEEVLRHAFSLTPYVVLNHHYLPNDFTVYLYRR